MTQDDMDLLDLWFDEEAEEQASLALQEFNVTRHNRAEDMA